VGLIALSASQLSAVDELLDGGRLGRVPADLNRASIFAAQAQDAITDLPHLTRPSNRYNLAYDACHDLGQALPAAYGYRTTNGPGQHETLGMFFRIVIDGPPGTGTPSGSTSCGEPGTSSDTRDALSAMPKLIWLRRPPRHCWLPSWIEVCPGNPGADLDVLAGQNLAHARIAR